VAAEPEMVGGAKRLAYLRLSTLGAMVRAHLETV